MTRRLLFLVLGLAVWTPIASAQPPRAALTSQGATNLNGNGTIGRHPEEGRPLIRVYRPVEIGGGGQHWQMVQDARGVLYSVGSGGVFEFDGASWRVIEMPNFGTGRSLAIDNSGRIYVGGVREVGFLEGSADGQLHFVSLVNRLPADAPQFGDVWRTLATPQGIVFQTEQALFRWANGAFQIIRPKSRFNRASLADGRIYLTMPETGLNVLDNDTFRPLPGTESLGREVYPLILRYDDKRLLIGTRTNGLFLYDGAALSPFATELDDIIKSTLYRGLELPDGTFALTTTSRGFGIIDRQGRRIAHIDVESGLPVNAVYSLMVDREGAIWTTLERGLARVETPSPATYFDRSDGFRGAFFGLRHNGRLYLAWQSGVNYLTPQMPGTRNRFQAVSGVNNQCWWFEIMRDPTGRREPALPAACSDGLYEIRDTTAIPIHAPADGTYRAAFLKQSKVDPTRLWIGMFDGLASFRWVDGKWIDEGRVAGITDALRSFVEQPDGSLLGGSVGSGAVLITFAATPEAGVPRPTASIERFGPQHGLAAGLDFVVPILGDAYFIPFTQMRELSVVRWDASNKRFVRDAAISALPFDRFRIGFGLFELPDHRVIANFGHGTFVLQRTADGSWAIDGAPFSRFGPTTAAGPPGADPDGVVWFGLQDNLVRFDMSRQASASTASTPFTALMRRVIVNQNDVLYAGTGSVSSPRLPAASNALRFEFAAPSFHDETATEYQTRLDGLDDDWSPWSTEARRDVTNLGLGDFRLHVRARNVVGRVSDEAVYAFTILPPWYRTWGAYAGYLVLLGLLVVAVDRVQRRRLLGKERERAQFNEAKLRAEAAEALARTESAGKKQVELLSDIGREITASLDIDTIFGRLYERVNQLADADVFGVGLYHPERREIEYRLAIEAGKRYAPYTRTTTDRDQLPVWCIEHKQPVFINDLQAEYRKYVSRYDEQTRQLEDGSMSRHPQSIIYLPLVAKDRVLGIITIQSFEKNAYTEHHLNVLQTLASYSAIALDNAAAYRQLNEQEHEIRRLFEEAQRARSLAEEADAAKSAFLSTVSHELRTPLTSVLGFAKIIKKRLEDRIFPLVPTDDRKVAQTIHQVAENLQVVVSEGERLTKLIDDVLDLAKIEAGKLEWHMEPVTVADVIDHATSATASLFEHKGLRLLKDVAPDLPSITGDRDRLIQVVINLISNAVKFTSAGTITVRVAQRRNEIVTSVIDTGMGIAPSDQPKVFERFKQVGDTLTDKPKGTGLGLPICREIVEHHGGRIWVESALGHGSTFSFSLPLPATAETAARREGPLELAALIRQLRDEVFFTAPRTADREPRILVVDDEVNIRELLTQEFSEAGYHVTTAANGRDAVAKVRADRPDLIVLDVMMPEMNGFDVAAVLKNDPATMDIPIIILSIVQDRERGFRIGVDRYLTKPINTDLLFREVGTLLEQKKSHRRVLVVDDDATTVKTLTDVLTSRGYSVTESSAADLITRAAAVQPDIILLNAISPVSSDAARMLRFEKGLENVLFLVYQ